MDRMDELFPRWSLHTLAIEMITMNTVKSTYKEVQGLSRGLKVLVALNAKTRAKANISTISSMTGIHRTTVKRLLETLRREGFVTFDEDTSTYNLGSPVKWLSAGYVDDEWIVEHTVPVMRRLSEKVLWPTDLTTFDIDSMIVRETTHVRTPFFFDKTMPGQRRPILLTAAGRAYFFASSKEKQEQILTVLRNHEGEEGLIARDPKRVQLIRKRCDQLGCAVNTGEWQSNRSRYAIAVPILLGREVLGCLNILFHSKAMTIEEAIAQNLPILKLAAREIADGVREANAPVDSGKRQASARP